MGKFFLLSILLATATRLAAASLVDQLSDGVRQAKRTAEMTGREAADAARSAADTAKRAAHTASNVKRMADDSGLTGAVINAGKDAMQRGIHALTPSPEPTSTPPPSDVHDAPARSEPAAIPSQPRKPTPPRHAHEPRPIRIDPAVLSAVAIAVAVIVALGVAACVVVRIRAHRIRTVHDKVMRASLEPIFAVATPALTEEPPARSAITP